MREPERLAFICVHKDCANTRVFLLPGDKSPPTCPNGHGRMTRQANVPYVAKSKMRFAIGRT